jgi:hypothetical protein
MVSSALQVLTGSTKAEPWRPPSEARKNSPCLVRSGSPVKRALAAGIGSRFVSLLNRVKQGVGGPSYLR